MTGATASRMAPALARTETRSERLERLAAETFDVLVIGGGAIGASTAWAAARAGARVALVDRGDAAGATSSASSKLVHGGLRYLGLGDVGLVREAHRERRWNARLVAPHLVRPLRFILPIAKGAPYGSTELRAGVLLYSALAGFRDGRAGRLSPREAFTLAPGLRRDADLMFVCYHDHQTDDARLVLAVLRTAEAHGAVWVNYAEVEGLRVAGGRVVGAEVRDAVGAHALSISARVVVNATGPWVDRVRRLENPRAGTSVQLSKGAHLVLASDEGWHAAVTSPLPGGRVSFAIPWHGMLLLGTTDEPFEGDPGTVTATEEDRAQILAEAAGSLAPACLGADRVRAAFAGLRVLPQGTAPTAGTRRETVVSVGPGGMISVAGGKLTTWRRIGVDVADRALGSIGRLRPLARPAPLLGAADPVALAADLGRRHPALPAPSREHLARVYGALALEVLAPAAIEPGLYEPIVPGAPDVLAQALYAVDHELAMTADDVLRRRTTISLRGLDAEARDRIASFLPDAAAR
jgi:glycerol-3-phosphate dehydrogenase